MNNTGGLSVVIGASLAHCDIYCMSDFSEEKLLSVIDRIKVIEREAENSFVHFTYFVISLNSLVSSPLMSLGFAAILIWKATIYLA